MADEKPTVGPFEAERFEGFPNLHYEVATATLADGSKVRLCLHAGFACFYAFGEKDGERIGYLIPMKPILESMVQLIHPDAVPELEETANEA